MAEQLIGNVTHYFSKPKVAAIKITDGQLSVGDTVHIVGHTSDFTQQIESMQIEHASVPSAKVGDNVGIQMIEHAREHDKVYRVEPV